MSNDDPWADTDNYDHLGPVMKGRLDRAEMDMAKVRDYIHIMADSASGYEHARVLCLLLSLAAPKPRPSVEYPPELVRLLKEAGY